MYTCVFSRRIQFQNCTDSELSWNSSTFFQKCLLWGNNLWMEVVQKLVAVALVSMVTSADGLQNCFGINLGMAAACAMVQAYARPQVRLYPIQVVCCKRIHECCFSFFLSCLHSLPLQPSVGSPNFGVRSFSILLACLLMSLFAIILSVYCRPLSCVDNFWFICLPLGCFTTNVAEIHRFACSLYSLFESCKCLVLGKLVNVSVVTNAEDLQVNLLQSFCFLCLALATLSFYYGWVWSSRAAFALPFVVTAVQGLRPDSPETLALRLWQDTDEFGWKFGEWQIVAALRLWLPGLLHVKRRQLKFE